MAMGMGRPQVAIKSPSERVRHRGETRRPIVWYALNEPPRSALALVPTANPNQLTESSESVDSSLNERSLQADLVHLDRAVPHRLRWPRSSCCGIS
jgi:hypothetical protein